MQKSKMRIGILLAVILVGCDTLPPNREVWMEALSQKNTGLAYLYRNDFKGAIESFESVTRLVPEEPLGHANRALTLLKIRDFDDAEKSIDRAVDLAPRDGEILSIQSDVLSAQGDRERALTILSNAVSLNESNVVLRYKYLTALRRLRGPAHPKLDTLDQLRSMLNYEPDNLAILVELNEIQIQMGQIREAIAGYERMSRLLVPVSQGTQTWSNRTQEALQRGDSDEAEFSAGVLNNLLVVDPAYRSSRDRLGDPSQISPPLYDFRAVPFDLTVNADARLVDMRFVDTGSEFVNDSLQVNESWTDIILSDVDGDGRLDIALAGLDELFIAKNGTEGWETYSHAWAAEPMGLNDRLLVGDVDNDGDTDIYTTGSAQSQVYHNTGDGTFILAQTVDSTEPYLPVFASQADFDHDGDLDILTYDKRSLRFLRHTDAGLFEDATTSTGFEEIENPGTNTTISDIPDLMVTQPLAWGDFDLDGAVDIVVLLEDGSLQFYRNLRQGRWINWTERFGDFSASGVDIIVAADFNNDGMLDLYLAGSENDSCQLWWNDSGSHFDRENTPAVIKNVCRGIKSFVARPVDFDNDGFIDLAVGGNAGLGKSGLQLLRNLGDGRFERQVSLLPSLPSTIEDLEVGDLDNDGDVDLVLLAEGRVIVLRNDGGNANGWLNIKLAAALEGSGKNNFYGIGSTIEIRAGSHYQSLLVDGPITHVGLGKRERADVIRVVWSNGVPQNRIAPESRTLIIEKQRLKGSCPSLYTWNGEHYEFVTHLMTRSAIGALTETGAPAYPDAAKDYVKIRGDQLREQDGKYMIRVVEELWDAVFMDKMELLVVDHPVETDIYVDEKYLPPPYPPLEIHTVTNRRLPIAARDHNGHDVLSHLVDRDSLYVGNFKLGDFQGVPEMHSITLDLGDLKGAKRIHLYMGGWIMPVEPSSNLALSQRTNVSVVPPYLETVDREGQWRTVIPYTGFPSGEHKTIFIDLTNCFPTDDYRIKLTTNLQLYWSEVFFTIDEPVHTELRIKNLSPVTADLHYRGYSREYQPALYGPFIRDYETLSGEPQWLPFEGYRTRYGDVSSLLSVSDNRYVIYSSGEEVVVTFDAVGLPQLPTGWSRDFVLHTDGWLKEGDLNTATAATIGPLPFHGMSHYPYGAETIFPDSANQRKYRDVYNTRWVSQEQFRKAMHLHGLGY